MIGALLLLWFVFNIVTDGRFLTPRNLFNLSVQTASVAVMATGMVFVIVTRHIDLSVGSLLGLLGMLMGALQLHVLPDYLGFGHWSIWIISVVFGVICGVIIGAFQGWIIGYLTVPAFIVTLGGLLVYRGAAWWVTQGQTVAPLDATYKLLGGGAEGTLGATLSWALGVIATIVAVVLMILSRKQKSKHGFTVKPAWAEATLIAIAISLIMGFVWVMNSYPIPRGAVKRIAEAQGLEIPEQGLVLYHGIAIPVLILLGIAIIMTVVAKRTRFGRYVYAMGGNPEAAQLSGINTQMLTVKVFALMGALTAIASVIASARLGAVGNDLGTLDELRVIAAAVIGGTALSGGFGTIYGAILGALIMQSLQSGMAMVGVDAPLQSIVVGVVLILAVYLDIVYRRKTGHR
jgi:D-xylose transport system permease protein